MNPRTKYRTIADRAIIGNLTAALYDGFAPWAQNWREQPPVQNLDGHIYRGVNFLLLESARKRNGFTSPIFATFQKIENLGGWVRRGEHGTKCVFWSAGGRRIDAYTVFNLDQIEGIPEDVRQRAPIWNKSASVVDLPPTTGKTLVWFIAMGFVCASAGRSTLNECTSALIPRWREEVERKTGREMIEDAQLAQSIADDLLDANRLIIAQKGGAL